MYYIRFLKPPSLTPSTSSPRTLNALLTIATDLGDAFFFEDTILQVNCLVSGEHADTIVAGPQLQWKAGMRSLPLSMAIDFEDEFEVSIEVFDESSLGGVAVELHDAEGDVSLPVVISATSELLGGDVSTSGKRVRRDILLREHQLLSIWEDSGESIARHTWDAGMGLVACLDVACHGTASGLMLLDELLRRPQEMGLNVLELGTGVGVVGLALATMRSGVRVALTDLESARELTEFNISESALNKDSEAQFVALDWEELVPEQLYQQQLDLILVADCTYNPESSPALVRTISSLVANSPRPCLALVAMKKRHPSEDVFFELMESAGMQMREEVTLRAPCSLVDEEDTQAQTIHVYAYSSKS